MIHSDQRFPAFFMLSYPGGASAGAQDTIPSLNPHDGFG